MAHSAEPWVVMTRPEIDGERLGDGSVVGGYTGRDEYDPEGGICSKQELREAAEQGFEPERICQPWREEDARRIVACVNACAGVPTENLRPALFAAAPELLEAARGALAVLLAIKAEAEKYHPSLVVWFHGRNRGSTALTALSAAVAKAERRE